MGGRGLSSFLSGHFYSAHAELGVGVLDVEVETQLVEELGVHGIAVAAVVVIALEVLGLAEFPDRGAVVDGDGDALFVAVEVQDVALAGPGVVEVVVDGVDASARDLATGVLEGAVGDVFEEVVDGLAAVALLEEQEELENRSNFLSTQVEDLNSSKTSLQQLIRRLNKKSREKFRQTFEEVRVQFQEIFRKLFGGGKADVLLEDTEDILDAGIEIIAKPPGKETRSISLLSGGEKSMTALALLFAVFKTKPSPFCFLDEVDAALDEANNERFNMLIREFEKHSQFIIITHAKRTMSIAEVLYGVTMQTRGVSKKISVSFGQYEPEEENAAVA